MSEYDPSKYDINYESADNNKVHAHLKQVLIDLHLLELPEVGPEPQRPALQLELDDERHVAAVASYNARLAEYERLYALWCAARAIHVAAVARRSRIEREIWEKVRHARTGLAALQRLRDMERAGRHVPIPYQRDLKKFMARAYAAFDANYPGMRHRTAAA